MASGPKARWIGQDTILLVVFLTLLVVCFGRSEAETTGFIGVMIWLGFGLMSNVQYKPHALKWCWVAYMVVQATVGIYLMERPDHLSVNGSWASSMLFAPVSLPITLALDRLNWFLHKDHFRFPLRGDLNAHEVMGRFRLRSTDYIFGLLSMLGTVALVEAVLAPLLLAWMHK